MTNIILCDVCGQITAAHVAGGVSYSANPEAEVKDYGLCAGCSEAVWRLLTGSQNEVRAIVKGFDPDAQPEPVKDQAETSRVAIAEHAKSERAYHPEEDL